MTKLSPPLLPLTDEDKLAGDQFKVMMDPILRQLLDEVRVIEAETGFVEAKVNLLKSEAKQDVAENEPNFELLEDLVKKRQRIAELLYVRYPQELGL
ncbi:hypothetical protein OPQ81_008933 [Rhizoctonia solani]|nr:hypothetical protein OPQ81_008933 [Rhizoctonia solani]